jgi:hypothetical protein
MQSDRDLLISACAGFNARELAAALHIMHPNEDWPNGMEGGRVHRHQGVREYWTRQWSWIDPHVEPIEFRTDGSGKNTVTIPKVVSRMDGDVLIDQLVEHAYLIENGLIRRMDILGE